MNKYLTIVILIFTYFEIWFISEMFWLTIRIIIDTGKK